MDRRHYQTISDSQKRIGYWVIVNQLFYRMIIFILLCFVLANKLSEFSTTDKKIYIFVHRRRLCVSILCFESVTVIYYCFKKFIPETIQSWLFQIAVSVLTTSCNYSFNWKWLITVNQLKYFRVDMNGLTWFTLPYHFLHSLFVHSLKHAVVGNSTRTAK